MEKKLSEVFFQRALDAEQRGLVNVARNYLRIALKYESDGK